MARIQILELPAQVAGDVVVTPFAIVIDQVETERVVGYQGEQPIATVAELTQDEADEIAQRIGAQGAILTACTMDVA